MLNGQLIVGGTSAGTAVQAGGQFNGVPIPMLSNGNPENAMPRGAFAHPPPSQRCQDSRDCQSGIDQGDLTYLATGGTGLFTLGLLDTHFSERERETRLAIFSAETKQRFAFGADETSALLVATKRDANGVAQSSHIKVIGQSGVFIVDRSLAQYQRAVGMNGEKQQVTVSAIAHYLNNGSQAVLEHATGDWLFALSGQRLTQKHSLKPLQAGVWRDQLRSACGTSSMLKWQQFGNQYNLLASPVTEYYWNKERSQCSYVHLPFVISYSE
jgi:hypothetical protein